MPQVSFETVWNFIILSVLKFWLKYFCNNFRIFVSRHYSILNARFFIMKQISETISNHLKIDLRLFLNHLQRIHVNEWTLPYPGWLELEDKSKNYQPDSNSILLLWVLAIKYYSPWWYCTHIRGNTKNTLTIGCMTYLVPPVLAELIYMNS